MRSSTSVRKCVPASRASWPSALLAMWLEVPWMVSVVSLARASSGPGRVATMPAGRSGVFERYGADRIFGFHVWPDLPAGVVATRPGPLLARASETTLAIHGTSSHIAKSTEGHDALLAGAHFLTEVEDLMQLLGETEPCLLKFGHMTSGTVRNAISAESVI